MTGRRVRCEDGPGVPVQEPSEPGTASTALAGGVGGPQALGPLLRVVLDGLALGAADRDGPVPAGGPAAVAAELAVALGAGGIVGAGPGADSGAGSETDPAAALGELVRAFAAGSVDPADPACAAHLHCPPLALAVAADLAASAVNASLDSWDQAPAALEIEDAVLRELADLVGFPASAGGVLTTGGTESNLMGLLLARERFGTAPAVLRTDSAHFSIDRAAGLLGLPEPAVHRVPADASARMDPQALDTALHALGGRPAVVVATAGTTDLGAIDPLPRLAAVARRYGAALHVDAAYGGGALFSERLAPLLTGLHLADTVSLDLHKLGWQPVAAGILLAREEHRFRPLDQQVAYLNPEDDQAHGYTSQLGRSLRTTRRADAFKIAATLRILGRSGLGALVDHCHDLARHAAARISAEPELELTADPVLTTVVFRYRGEGRAPAAVLDGINAGLRRELLAGGRAVIGRTEIGPGTGPGRIRLKLTLLNPHAGTGAVDALLDAVLRAGRTVAGALPETGPPPAPTSLNHLPRKEF